MSYRNAAAGKTVFKNALEIDNFSSAAIVSPSSSYLQDVPDFSDSVQLYPGSIFAPKKLISAGYGDLTASNAFVDLQFLWSISKRKIGGGVPVAYAPAPNDMTRTLQVFKTGAGPKDAFISLGQFARESSPFNVFSSLACYDCKTQTLANSFFNYALEIYPSPFGTNIPISRVHRMQYPDYMATDICSARPWSSTFSPLTKEDFSTVTVGDIYRAQDFKALDLQLPGFELTNYNEPFVNIAPLAGALLTFSEIDITVSSTLDAPVDPSKPYNYNLYAVGGTANTLIEWNVPLDPLTYSAEFDIDCTSSFTSSFPATGTPSSLTPTTCETQNISNSQTLTGTCTATMLISGNSQPQRSINGAVSIGDETLCTVSCDCEDVTNYTILIESDKAIFSDSGDYVGSPEPVVTTLDFSTTSSGDFSEAHQYTMLLPDASTKLCSYSLTGTYTGTRDVTNVNTGSFTSVDPGFPFPRSPEFLVACEYDLNIAATVNFTVKGSQLLAISKDFFVLSEVDYTVNCVSTWRTLHESYTEKIYSYFDASKPTQLLCEDYMHMDSPPALGYLVFQLNSGGTGFNYYKQPATMPAWLFSGASLFTPTRDSFIDDLRFISRAFTSTYTLTLNNGANYKTTIYARDSANTEFTSRELSQSWCSYSFASYTPGIAPLTFVGTELIPHFANTLNETSDVNRYVQGVYSRTYKGSLSTVPSTTPTNAKSIADLVYDEHVASGGKFILARSNTATNTINLWRCDYDKYTGAVSVIANLGETANFLGINSFDDVTLIITEGKYEVAHLGTLAYDNNANFAVPMMQDENTFVYAPFVDEFNTAKLNKSPQYIDWYKYDSDTNLYVRQPLKKATVVKSNDTVDNFTLIATSAYVPN